MVKKEGGFWANFSLSSVPVYFWVIFFAFGVLALAAFCVVGVGDCEIVLTRTFLSLKTMVAHGSAWAIERKHMACLPSR